MNGVQPMYADHDSHNVPTSLWLEQGSLLLSEIEGYHKNTGRCDSI